MRRIDELFAIEREINGKPPDARRAVRQDRSKPLVAALEGYMREQLERLSPKNDVATAIRYMLTRWPSFTRFLDDGKICLSNNAAERALRCVAVGRRNWTFAGSDAGGRRAAAVYSLIETCKHSDVDPRAWLADVLAKLPDHPRPPRRRDDALGLEGPPRSHGVHPDRRRRVADRRAPSTDKERRRRHPGRVSDAYRNAALRARDWRDVDAVRNGLTEGWSNGQTEGQINRLKTLKRAMYGRASTELLRARMLPFYLPLDHRV